MGRPSRFSADQLLDAAAGLLITGGPSALTAAGVAREAGAPSGSVYHRFASRDQLAASLWMRTVERFDDDVVAGLRAPGDPVTVAVAAATKAVAWCTSNPVDAFILTMFRRADLVVADLGPELAGRAKALGTRQKAAIEALAGRLDRPADLVSFAVAGIPMAAIRRYVGDRSPIPAWVPVAVEHAVRAALTIVTAQDAEQDAEHEESR